MLTWYYPICVNRFHQSRTGRLAKNTVYILWNRSITLTGFDNQLMGLIVLKGSSTNSDHCIFMFKVGEIWFESVDVKTIKIEFNNFCNFNTIYILFYKRSTQWNYLRDLELVQMDATCWVSWWEGIETLNTQQVLLKTSFYCLPSFTFVIYLIHWPLSPATSSVWCWSSFVCSGLTYEIYSGGGPSMFVYCMVC